MPRVKSAPLVHGPARWLVTTTLGYLALPVFLFCLGWLQLPWAIGFTLILGIGLRFAMADFHRAELSQALNTWLQRVTWRGVAATVLICFGLIIISGVGGYGYQTGDWAKHEILLKDLVDYEWPVFYDYYGVTIGLVYYVAYYVPPALIGKLGGMLLANQALVVWTLAGLILSVFWFALAIRRSLVVGLAFFLLFSGVSVVGFLLRFYAPVPILAGAPDLNTAPWQTHPALWAATWQYSPHVRGLFWVPQHVLPGWLITGMILFVLATTTTRRSLLFLWALSVLWSPFITIGLVPFFLADLLPRPHRPFGERVRAYLSIANGCGVALFGLLAIFYATKLTPIAPVLNQGMRVGLSLVEMAQRDGWPRVLFSYLLFCLLEFGLYFWLDRGGAVKTVPALRWTYRLVFLWLAALPLIVLGQHNDLTMRASIPALFFVAVVVGRNGAWLQQGARWRKGLWLMVILLGTLSPLYEVGYQLARAYQRGALYAFDLNPNRNLAEKYVLDASIMQQYASSVDTFFFHTLAKAGAAATTATNASSFIFSDSLTLVDFILDRQTANPGDTLDLLLLWRAVQPVTANYVIAVRLVDEQGQVWWAHQAWPAGAPTSTWAVARRIWYDHHTPTLPSDLPPGLYRLEIYFTDPETQAKLPARRVATGETVGEIVPLTYVVVGTPQGAPPHPLTSNVAFGGQITLLGSNLAPKQNVTVGAPLAVTLVWQAVRQPEKDYTGFVQVLDAQGQLVAQQDHPLTNNFLPATRWQPGLTLADVYQIDLPADLAPGAYHVIVGIYDAATGARLPLAVDSTDAGDAFIVSELTITN